MKNEWRLLHEGMNPPKEGLAFNKALDVVKALFWESRGLFTEKDRSEFLAPNLDQLHDPFEMADMEQAVQRLKWAIDQKQKILVYGDYDVDGTTAVTLMFSFLKGQNADCLYYIPNRYREGYGFSFEGVEFAKTHGVQLIITLDCGIKDALKIQHAKDYGIDVIICDHHNPGELPPAFAVLDPKRSDCPYPYKGLSGCGVGFKLAQAYCIRSGISLENIFTYLDLVAISIGADIVPLTGENRVLAFHGLQQLQNPERLGLKAILECAGYKKIGMTISDVVFVIAPRINAVGRIDEGSGAVDLLLAENMTDAMIRAKKIESYNRDRKELDKAITQEALTLVREDDFYESSFSTVVAKENWHKGVIGIVASRLIEQHYKPTIVLTQIEDKMVGSARSIEGIDLYEVLGECSDLLEQYGGHTMAAGLTLKPEKFFDFRQKFDTVIKDRLSHVFPYQRLNYDFDIVLDDANWELFRFIEKLAPFGPENMKPVFVSKHVFDAGYSKAVGEDKSHLKLHLKQEKSIRSHQGIAFGFGHFEAQLKQGVPFDIMYTLEKNEWQGNETLQLMIRDIRLAE